jgi:hypothetical protein
MGGLMVNVHGSEVALRRVKLLHTAIWFLFASAILAIPVLALTDHLGPALVLIAFVMVECAVLVLNRMRCPLTSVAARYTDDRRENFDIYLPLWLAKWNKVVFGSLFVVGIAITVVRWWLPGAGG